MARANNATPVLNSVASSMMALGTDAAFAAIDDALTLGGILPSDLVDIDDWLPDVFLVDLDVPSLLDRLPSIPVYAWNLDLLDGGLLSFNLKEGEEKYPPTHFEREFVLGKVQLCYLLQPMQGVLLKYFRLLKKKPWQHAYLESKEVLEPPHPAAGFVQLGPSTWMTAVRESARDRSDSRYAAWTSPWQSMGGLGVRTGFRSYGELGAMAVTSVRVFADKVVWFNPLGYRGWVELVPADRKILELLFGSSMGVMH